jgi:flagellar assembly protein FliH
VSRSNLKELSFDELTDTNGKAEKKPVTKYSFSPLPEIGRTWPVTLTETQEAIEEGQKQLAKVREEAERTRQEALKEVEAIKEAAMKQGLAEGHTQVQEGFEASVAKTMEVLHAIENLYMDLLKANEATLVKLALTIAQRVIMHEVQSSPEVIAEAFKAALTHLDNVHEAVMKVHPDDLAHLESVREELKQQIQDLIKITFEPDPNLRRGDLMVDTEAGRLDGTIKQRFETVIAAVDEELRKNFDLE